VVRKGGQKMTPKRTVVLELIKQDTSISRKDLSKKLNINESAVQKYLDILKEKMVIKRVGPDKGGYWVEIGFP
jgi:ATP-dependent DNA helicase RecG